MLVHPGAAIAAPSYLTNSEANHQGDDLIPHWLDLPEDQRDLLADVLAANALFQAKDPR